MPADLAKIHCDPCATVIAPRHGCICEACATVRRGIKDDFDVNDLDVIARRQQEPALP